MRQPEFITQALAELRRKRPCRSCGRPFRPGRIDALTCSETCRWRRSHGQPDYLDGLSEATRSEARARHDRIETLIKDVKAHTAAVRERRRERRVNEQMGGAWIKARIILALECLKHPDSTQKELIHAALSNFQATYPPEFVTANVEQVMAAVEIGRQWVFQHPTDSRAALTRAVSALGKCERWIAETIVSETLWAVATATTRMTGPAVPSRPLSPEATAIIEKIIQTWRHEVVKAISDVLKEEGLVPPDRIRWVVAKALPHIPAGAIATILKELMK